MAISDLIYTPDTGLSWLNCPKYVQEGDYLVDVGLLEKNTEWSRLASLGIYRRVVDAGKEYGLGMTDWVIGVHSVDSLPMAFSQPAGTDTERLDAAKQGALEASDKECYKRVDELVGDARDKDRLFQIALFLLNKKVDVQTLTQEETNFFQTLTGLSAMIDSLDTCSDILKAEVSSAMSLAEVDQICDTISDSSRWTP